MKDNVTPDMLCPFCGYHLDRAASLDGDATPKQGDLSVCISCAEIGQFDAEIRLQKPDPDQLETMKKDQPEQWAALEKAQRIIRTHVIPRRGKQAEVPQ